MKYTTAMVLASAAAVSADCSITSFEEGGNWFCQAVSLIKYTGLDTTGSYSAVSAMDATTGDCTFEDQAYSGAIAPFDGELSVHIRGPTQLKQFAVYTPSTSSTKKRSEHKSHHKRHGHQHLHKKHTESKQEAARAVGDIVTATIDGKVVTWTNTWSGVADAAVAAVESAVETSAASAATSASSKTSTSKSTKTSTSSSSASTFDATGDYTRVAYYNAEDATSDGVTFLGTHGGAGSGVFDTVFGSSLSYVTADGCDGAESSTVLDNVLVGDNVEYAIFSDVECTSDSADCGFYRDGTVAYQGFSGSDKVFLFEFTMPLSGDTSGANGDMPAIWLLNGKIPRTQQYGDCSCWQSGCGEADLFEVLASGDTKAKSTFHFLNSLGSSDYFDRPTTDYIKIAAVFQASTSTASIKVLDSSVDFSAALTADTVESFVVEDTESLLSTIMDFLTSK